MTREDEIIKASHLYAVHQQKPFLDGARWADRHCWKHVKDGLPAYDREVVVFIHQHLNQEDAGYRVSLGHRPNPNGYVVVDGEKLYAKTYDGWNQPDVEWWLDVDLPFSED